MRTALCCVAPHRRAHDHRATQLLLLLLLMLLLLLLLLLTRRGLACSVATPSVVAHKHACCRGLPRIALDRIWDCLPRRLRQRKHGESGRRAHDTQRDARRGQQDGEG